jgi:phage/plasmid-associated DNA primase
MRREVARVFEDFHLQDRNDPALRRRVRTGMAQGIRVMAMAEIRVFDDERKKRAGKVKSQPAPAPAPVPAAGLQAPAFSEEAIALMFADLHADELRYVGKWGTWLRYNGARWEIDETYNIFSLVRKLCRQVALQADTAKLAKAIASGHTVAAVERLARSDRRIAATVSQWDADPWLLNTPGGVVDLRSGRMRKHRREDYMTKITAVAPKGDCPKFKKFLNVFSAPMPRW